MNGPKQNARSLMTPVSDTDFMPFHMVGSLHFVLHGRAPPITAYFKAFDWLLKKIYQSENGLKSYNGWQNRESITKYERA